jgi:hypothetical protein
MKYTLRYTLLFATILLVASSCKKSVPEQTKYIPKDAVFVFDLNWKSLSDKASKGNINWDSLYRSMADEHQDSAVAEGKKMMQDFMRSGVDTTKDIFFFAKMGGGIMSGQQVSGGVVAVMKDASAFEAYLKKQPLVSDVKKNSNYSSANVDGKFTVGWNSDVIIIAGTQDTQNFRGDMGSGSSQGVGSDEQVLGSLFSLKEDESVSTIPEFQDLMKEKGDMLFWSNSSSAFGSVPLLGMTKIADLFKDSYGAGVINFEDGKVTSSFKSYSGKDLGAIWEKYKGPQVDMNLVNQFPSTAEGYAAFSFNPQIIAEIIKYGGFESAVKEFMDKAGFSMDDILKIFKGDFAVVFGDINYEEMPYNFDGQVYKSKRPTAKVIFNATIADKAAYDKVAAKLAENGLMEMKNGQYVPKELGGMAWSMDGKNLIIATDTVLMQQYLANKGNAGIPSNIADQSKGKSVAFYVDINKIATTFAKDSEAGEASKAAQATFNNLVATSSNYNGKYVEGKMDLKMVNDKENSLVSLVKFFAAVSKEAARMEHKMDHGMSDMDMQDMPDTGKVLMPPPPPSRPK